MGLRKFRGIEKFFFWGGESRNSGGCGDKLKYFRRWVEKFSGGLENFRGGGLKNFRWEG